LSHSFITQVSKFIAKGATVKKYIVKCCGCEQAKAQPQQLPYANKQGQITCPNKDKPGVQDYPTKARNLIGVVSYVKTYVGLVVY
jgi:hypothetical protein